MLSAHDLYLAGHKILFACSSNEELQSVCSQVVENYLENRSIWKELTHYKKMGTLLAAHPIFAWNKRKEELRQMGIGELVKLRTRHGNNLIRARKTLRDNPFHRLSHKRKEHIFLLEQEMKEIDHLLSIR